MMKRMLFLFMLLSSNAFGQTMSPEAMAITVRELAKSDALAKWHEATAFMTHEEKIAYTKAFLAALEKHVTQEQVQQELNQKIQIGVGIAAAIIAVVVIYYLLKSPPSSAQPAATKRTKPVDDPFPPCHQPPPAYTQPYWAQPAKSRPVRFYYDIGP